MLKDKGFVEQRVVILKCTSKWDFGLGPDFLKKGH